MVGGTGVVLAPESVVRDAELFVAVDVEGGERGIEARVAARERRSRRRGSRSSFPGAVHDAPHDHLRRATERLLARTVVRYHDLVLDEESARIVAREEIAALLGRAAADDP
jgi:hypothetical protein